MRQSPWSWIPSLFAAGEVPAAIIMYVALLMFLQAGTPLPLASLCCGCLFVPWVLKAPLRARVKGFGYFHRQIQLTELAIVLVLVGVSAVFSVRGAIDGWLFGSLFLLSVLMAWHDLALCLYYETMLPTARQPLWNGVRMFFSQTATVFTYGLVIMFVGALQVVYRNIRLGWCQGLYMVAGLFLIFTIYHALFLPSYNVSQRCAFGEEGFRERLAHVWHHWLAVALLLLLLLPQSLMFLSRVVFLLTPASEGGLGCTIQDIAFAQGAVGVIAYTIGAVLGRQAMKSDIVSRPFWLLAVSLGLSPSVYVFMTVLPPHSLPALCVATFTAQFLFGFGIPVCDYFVMHISGVQHHSAVGYMRLPAVVAVMLPPICLSGCMLSSLGFRWFFAVDALLAPVSWLVIYIIKGTRAHTREKK